MDPPLILIVEDEPSIADSLQYALSTEGFATHHCLDGRSARAFLDHHQPKLVLLDVGLPDVNGFDWCKDVRKFSDVPIVFLTARSDEVDRIVGLEIGADDYIAKPFSPREVSARVRAILRRGRMLPGTDAVAATDIEINEAGCRAKFCGRDLTLTRYEFRLLAVLVAQPGRVFSRSDLMNAAWEDPGSSLDRTVDAHVKLLRGKLREVDPDRNPIKTHRGLGYSWERGA